MTATYPVGTPMDEVDRTGPFLGGSDAPVVALGNVYGKTPAQLYLEKTGQAQGFSGNKFTRAGQALEPFIREWMSEFLDTEIVEVPPWVPHPDRPWQRASLDGLADGFMVEIKTTSSPQDWGESWSEDGVPARHQIQCQHNMPVYDLSRAIVCMVDVTGFVDKLGGIEPEPSFCRQLVRLLDKRLYEVFLDRPYVDSLLEVEHEFVQRVERLDPPPAQDIADVRALYPRGNHGTVEEATSEQLALVYDLAKARVAKKAAEDREREIMAKLGAQMRTISALRHGDEEVLRWKNDKGFDREAFAAKYPALHEEYCRVLDVKSLRDDYPEHVKRFMREGLGARKMTLTKHLKAAVEGIGGES